MQDILHRKYFICTTSCMFSDWRANSVCAMYLPLTSDFCTNGQQLVATYSTSATSANDWVSGHGKCGKVGDLVQQGHLTYERASDSLEFVTKAYIIKRGNYENILSIDRSLSSQVLVLYELCPCSLFLTFCSSNKTVSQEQTSLCLIHFSCRSPNLIALCLVLSADVLEWKLADDPHEWLWFVYRVWTVGAIIKVARSSHTLLGTGNNPKDSSSLAKGTVTGIDCGDSKSEEGSVNDLHDCENNLVAVYALNRWFQFRLWVIECLKWSYSFEKVMSPL